jgi:hypothetical protein
MIQLLNTKGLLQCRASPIDKSKLVMYLSGDIECYGQWYHIMTFCLLPFIAAFPFGLAYIAHRRRIGLNAIRRQITVIYRSRAIAKWGHTVQMFRRFLLVTISTFAQVPETVRPFHICPPSLMEWLLIGLVGFVKRAILLQILIGLLLTIHLLGRPFASMEANVVEGVSLLSLLIIASFNVAAAARVTGGVDPSNAAITDITVALMLCTIIIGVLAWIRDKVAQRNVAAMASLPHHAGDASDHRNYRPGTAIHEHDDHDDEDDDGVRTPQAHAPEKFMYYSSSHLSSTHHPDVISASPSISSMDDNNPKPRHHSSGHSSGPTSLVVSPQASPGVSRSTTSVVASGHASAAGASHLAVGAI